MPHPLFKFSPKITAIPVIHGSGDFAVEIRRIMLADKYDCLAVPLPPSFKHDTEQAIESLPTITLVTQREAVDFNPDSDTPPSINFVPIDPCQPVIAALRVAMGERMRREFIDLEVDRFVPYSVGLPDPYALKRLPLEKFVAAALPAIPYGPKGQPRARVRHMARRLRDLERKHN